MTNNPTPRQLDAFVLKVFQFLLERIETGKPSENESKLFTRLEMALTNTEWDRSQMKSFELEIPDDVMDVVKLFGKHV
jgi:hypothetical protein